MSDLISRQSAYDTLTEYYHHRTDAQHDALRDALNRVPSAQQETSILTVKCEFDDEEWSRAIEDVKNAELELIAARKEQRWIPVSERLPEEEDMYKCPQNRYICQMNNAGVFLVLARLRHLGSPMAAFWDWYGKRVPDKDVVAWMPLPEAYKGEES